MTLGGWVIMIGSVGAILTLVTYCLVRVLSLPPADLETHLKAPPDIELPGQGQPANRCLASGHL